MKAKSQSVINVIENYCLSFRGSYIACHWYERRSHFCLGVLCPHVSGGALRLLECVDVRVLVEGVGLIPVDRRLSSFLWCNNIVHMKQVIVSSISVLIFCRKCIYIFLFFENIIHFLLTQRTTLDVRVCWVNDTHAYHVRTRVGSKNR